MLLPHWRREFFQRIYPLLGEARRRKLFRLQVPDTPHLECEFAEELGEAEHLTNRLTDVVTDCVDQFRDS